MVIGQIWLNANPGLRDHLRKVNEERSAVFYALTRLSPHIMERAFGHYRP